MVQLIFALMCATLYAAPTDTTIDPKTRLLDLKSNTIVDLAKIVANPDDAKRLTGGAKPSAPGPLGYDSVSFLHGKHSVDPSTLYNEKEDKDPLCVVDFDRIVDAEAKELFSGASLALLKITTTGPATTFTRYEEDGKKKVLTINDSSSWIDMTFWDPEEKSNVVAIACRAKGESRSFTVGDMIESLGKGQIDFTLPLR